MADTKDTARRVDVREKWPNEALDFTPWLADHLCLLGEALGLKLTKVRTEAPVGGPPYYCDILARETNKDVLVAIENQLEWTDFSHLAQTLIYSAGLDARIAIWVATEFRYESAQVLNWLNTWTSDEIEFYGVKVAITKTGDSFDEPSFDKVVWPGGWSTADTLKPVPGMEPGVQKVHDFFQPLTIEALRTGLADRSTQYFGYTGRFFPSRFDKDTGYAVSFWKNGAWVSLHVRTWDSIERNNRIFDELQTAKSEIEQAFGAECVWHGFEPYSLFTVSIRRDGSIDDPPEKLEETRAWMLDLLPKFKKVFDPRLEEILKQAAP